jgi:streptogramin lyase
MKMVAFKSKRGVLAMAVTMSLAILVGGTSMNPASSSTTREDFHSPVSVVAGRNGVWVEDNTGTNVLTEINPSNGSIRRRMSLHVDTGLLTGPGCVAVSTTHLWVTNSGYNALVELNPSGSVERIIDAKRDAFDGPYAIAAGATVRLWVANTVGNSVTELNALNGSLVRVINAETDDFAYPTSITYGDDRVWVMNAAGDSITELNAADGSLVRVIGLSSIGPLSATNTIAFSLGHVWLTTQNSVVELNAANDATMRVIKSKAEGITWPQGIASSGSHIWITNNTPNSVTILNAENGSLLRVIRDKADDLSNPQEVTGGDGHVWVTNVSPDSVTELNAFNGNLVRVIR